MRPLEGPITHDFNKHKTRTPASKNPGTDYAVAVGTPVKAIADGIVSGIVTTFAGAGGRMIFIDFPSGHKADYLHLSRIDVAKGDAVKKGQVIGLSGGSGLGKELGYGPHLHLSFRVGGKATMATGNIDFEAFLAEGGSTPSTPTAPVSASGKPTLSGLVKIGSTGEVVKYIQSVLGITVDGQFGPITDKAVKDFQLANGLKSDGIVGPLTFAKLDAPTVITPKPAPPIAPVSTGRTYKVVSGDNLTKIANKFRTTVPKLVALNAIKNPNLIFAGQVLRID